MKSLFKLLLPLLFVIPAFAQLPVTGKVKVDTAGYWLKQKSAINASTVLKNGGTVKVDTAGYYTKQKNALNGSSLIKEGGTVKVDATYFEGVKEVISRVPKTIEELALEGRGRWQIYSNHNYTATPGTVTAGAQVSGAGGFFVRAGKKFIMTSLTLASDGPSRLDYILDMDTSKTWYQYLGFTAVQNIFGTNRFYQVFGPQGGSVTFTIPTGYTIFENQSFTAAYISSNTTARNISWVVTGIEIPNEPNPDAKYKIAIFGDSTAWGNNLGNDESGRAFLGSSQWSEVFRDNCRANGIDAQIFANMAEDGRRMEDGYYGLMMGFNKIKYDLAFVSYGMNNAVDAGGTATERWFSTSSEAKFKEAAKAFILERNKYNKGAILVFKAPNNTDDPSRTTGNRIGIIRQWIYDVANDPIIGGTANKVYYIDQSAIFPLAANQATDLNFKNTERAVGSSVRVHPSGTGSTLIGNYDWNFLKGPLFGK